MDIHQTVCNTNEHGARIQAHGVFVMTIYFHKADNSSFNFTNTFFFMAGFKDLGQFHKLNFHASHRVLFS